LETLLAALVGAGATVIVALIGVIGAYKLKIGVNQDRLIETLNFLIHAQENKIKLLEDQAKIYESKIEELVKKVDELERVVVLQAETIEKLSREADNKNISP
jgi:uncharacterized coiled-coil protein SlyX